MKISGICGDSSSSAIAAFRPARSRQRRQPVAQGTVADLVVVLQEIDEGGRRHVAARLAARLAVTDGARVRPGRRSPAPGDRASSRPGRRHNRRNSRSVSPVSSTCSTWWKSSFHCASMPSRSRWRVVLLVLEHEMHMAVGRRRARTAARHFVGIQSFRDRVHRVEPQAVEAEFAQPVQRVLGEETRAPRGWRKSIAAPQGVWMSSRKNAGA